MIRDAGCGMRDAGYRIQDAGYRMQDAQFGIAEMLKGKRVACKKILDLVSCILYPASVKSL